MELDLATRWQLWFFGACFAGMAIGALVGKLSRFEIGMGVGLLLAGVTSLSFTPRFALAYRDMETTREMAGGAIASLLFGTFPFSAGLYFLVTSLLPERAPDRRSAARAERQERSYLNWFANLLMLGGITSVLVTQGSVLEQIAIAFGVAALGMWLHVANGIRSRADPRWTLGIAVVALNFSVWVLALALLREW